MKYTIISASARLNIGVLVLNKGQAHPRRHNLKALGKDRFEIVSPVEFKVGEVIGYEGDLPKALATVMIDEAAAKKEAAKKEKAEAAKKAKVLEALEAEIKALEDDLSNAKDMDVSLEIEAKLDAKVAEYEAAKG